MILDDKNIKNIVRYGLLIIIPLFVACVLLGGYNLYILLLKNINNVSNTQRQNSSMSNDKQSNIKRLSYLKYTHQNVGNDESIYLIELVKIGQCKYIIVSKKDQSPSIIHAHDCENKMHIGN